MLLIILNMVLKSDQNDFHSYSIFDITKVTSFSIKLKDEIDDLIEIKDDVYFIVTKNNKLLEYNSKTSHIKIIEVLNDKPEKIIKFQSGLVFVGIDWISILDSKQTKINTSKITKAIIENCFVFENQFVLLTSTGEKTFELEVFDLKRLKTREFLVIKREPNETVDLFLGVVPYVNYITFESDNRLLLTFSRMFGKCVSQKCNQFNFVSTR